MVVGTEKAGRWADRAGRAGRVGRAGRAGQAGQAGQAGRVCPLEQLIFFVATTIKTNIHNKTGGTCQ
jgi:hypothetical protein